MSEKVQVILSAKSHVGFWLFFGVAHDRDAAEAAVHRLFPDHKLETVDGLLKASKGDAQQWFKFLEVNLFNSKRKYRKTLAVEAEQFIPDIKPWPAGVIETNDSPTGFGIMTLESTRVAHEVTPGDYIITGPRGEKYACKEGIFRETYTLAAG